MKKVVKMFLVLYFVFIIKTVDVSAEEILLAPSAKSAILLEASTGEVIFEKNSHEKLHPASMTKMMSMLLILENIDKGVIKWDDIVTVSSNASGMGGSQILLETGEQMSVYDLFKGISVASGNDAVVAMAEKIAGTEEMFVEMMNKRANELGLTDTNFKNCHGLDDANHYSSASDMAKIARELVKHEKLFEFTSIYEDYLREGTDRKFWLVNTNKLVRFYEGLDGLKTGYTSGSGFCLTATAKRNDVRLISVIMNASSSAKRNEMTKSLLDYGFNKIKSKKMYSANEKIGTLKVLNSKQNKVDLYTTSDIVVMLDNEIENPKIKQTIKTNKDIKAPLKKGDIVGKLIIEVENDIYEFDLMICEDIKEYNYINRFFDTLKSILA